MKENKKVGIWMDHASANIMELANNKITTKTIKSDDGTNKNRKSKDKDETHEQNKFQHEMTAYYKVLSETIIKFDEIVLFGPTDAKTELLNLLHSDKQFDDKIIQTETTDNITENQQSAFVLAYFNS